MIAATPEWLATLKPGDEVVMVTRHGSWMNGDLRIYKIKRETPGQFVLDAPGFPRVRRSDGLILGGDHRRIRPVTDDVRRRIREATLKTWARYSASDELAACPLDVIESAYRIVRAAIDAQQEKTPC